MLKSVFVSISIMFLLVLTGCGDKASGITFKEYSPQLATKKDSAKVVIFRPDRMIASAETVLVMENSKNRGELLPVGFLAFDIPIEITKLHTETGYIDRIYTLSPESGGVYYFEMQLSNYIMVGALDLVPTNEEVAFAKMQHLRESIKVKK
ncbi:MAG: hypothetical protein PF437_10160 [Sulfurimonas sp.]|jgi:hypothetical protein|nr:hypothetical protein [Sulfurimonas sp.]